MVEKSNFSTILCYKFSISIHLLSMMLDDTRGGLDASSLHRDTSMDISLAKHILASLVSSIYISTYFYL